MHIHCHTLKIVWISFHHMVHPLVWGGGLCASITQRAMLEGVQAPGRVTHAGQVKGQRTD